MKTKLILPALFTALLLAFSLSLKANNPPVSKSLKATTVYSMNELKKNLEYDYAKASIRIVYDDRLDQLAKLMKDKNLAVALRGHADAKDSFKPNWVLSQKRADAVKDYLVSKGVPADKIISTAFGSTVPVASNTTVEGRQKNRRVEIKLNGGSEELSSR
jgi:outer membrane protein OmpA-like peptidoglycan-associated protein